MFITICDGRHAQSSIRQGSFLDRLLDGRLLMGDKRCQIMFLSLKIKLTASFARQRLDPVPDDNGFFRLSAPGNDAYHSIRTIGQRAPYPDEFMRHNTGGHLQDEKHIFALGTCSVTWVISRYLPPFGFLALHCRNPPRTIHALCTTTNLVRTP